MKELLIAISGLPRSKKGSKIMAKNKKVEPKQEDTVSRAEFNALAGGVKDLVDLIKSGALTQPAAPTPQEAREEKAVKEAGSNKYTVNPEWEDLAREIIGESMDHTEIQYIKGGGLMFTVVIKEEFSNAPADYLERYKSDRRSKEVGSEGEAGVRIWCEQIRNNLKRPRNIIND